MGGSWEKSNIIGFVSRLLRDRVSIDEMARMTKYDNKLTHKALLVSLCVGTAERVNDNQIIRSSYKTIASVRSSQLRRNREDVYFCKKKVRTIMEIFQQVTTHHGFYEHICFHLSSRASLHESLDLPLLQILPSRSFFSTTARRRDTRSCVLVIT